ncbi:MAG: hypothetical protein IKS88_00110 [Clostridia bacterium]|nr:hypothetical protein [Clostridia bacterium]
MVIRVTSIFSGSSEHTNLRLTNAPATFSCTAYHKHHNGTGSISVKTAFPVNNHAAAAIINGAE